MSNFKLLDTRAFFLGLAVSFIGLSVYGWWVTNSNVFHDYHRSYQQISNETQYFPTARQMMALVKDRLDGEKVAVIVSGSSVMRGAGQSEEDLWTNYLQSELGVGYSVLNLALNGGGPGGQGLYLAEYLLRENKKVIFISDISMAGIGITQDNGPVYQYFFFDANARGITDNLAGRMEEVRDRMKVDAPDRWEELQLRSHLNRVVNFDDLWNTVGYRYFFTVWTVLTAEKPWVPRRDFPDSEPNCSTVMRYKNYLSEEMAITRGFVNASPISEELDHVMTTTVPSGIKRRTLFVLNGYSPFYIEKLNISEKHRYQANIYKAADRYKGVGITPVVNALDYTLDDFCDRVHFSKSGGEKLAKVLAPHIRQKAKELKYE